MLTAWLHKDYILKWYHDPDAWLVEVAGRNGEFSWIHHYIVMDGEAPIGFCQYYDCYDGKDFENWYIVTQRGDTFSIDYLIGDEGYLSKGYGKEVVQVLTEHIKCIEDAREIVVQPDDDNGASNGVLSANGYVYEEGKRYYRKLLK